MDTNLCFRCRFGSVKIEVLVPEKYSLKQFAKQTQDFTAGVMAVTGNKPIHYSLRVHSAPQMPKLDFNVSSSCNLNIDKDDCSKFNLTADRNFSVKHLEQVKKEEETDFGVIRTV